MGPQRHCYHCSRFPLTRFAPGLLSTHMKSRVLNGGTLPHAWGAG